MRKENTVSRIGLYSKAIMLLTLAGMVITGAGCGNPPVKPVAQESPKPALKIATFTWPGHGPFYVAKEKGFFKEAGIDVELSRIDGVSERRAAIQAGRVDAIATGLEEVVILRANGVDLKAVLETDQSNGADGLVAKKTIQQIGDLKGKTVAYEEGSPSHIFLTQVLKRAGLTTKDVEPKYMSPEDAGAAFTSGKVDAAVTWEPWLTKAKEMTDSHLLISTAEEPGLIAAVLAVRADTLKNRREDWVAVLRAWFKAVDFCKNRPDEANQIMANVFELPSADIAKMLQKDLIAGEKENRAYFGEVDGQGMAYQFHKAISAEWQAGGLIKAIEPSGNAIDPIPLRQIHEATPLSPK